MTVDSGHASTVRQGAGSTPLRMRLPRGILAGFAWAILAVTIFSGWFVVTRFSVTRELRIWDITALRFGIGAILLAPAVLRRGSRLPIAAWREGLLFALLWGAPFVLLAGLGLQLTSAALAASIAATLMPVFAGLFRLALRAREAANGRLAGLCGDPRRAGLPDHHPGGLSGRTQPGRHRRPGPRRRHVGRLHAAVSPQRAHADPVGGDDLYLVRALLPAGLYSARPQPFRSRLDARDLVSGHLSRTIDERRRYRRLQPVRGAARRGRRQRHDRAPPSHSIHPCHPRPQRGPDAGRKRGHPGHRGRRPFSRQAPTLPITPSNPTP